MASNAAYEKVLLVEDIPSMQTVVRSLLSTTCQLTSVATLADAEVELNSKNYALVLLDVILPDGNGFDFCVKLRKNLHFANLPIIFLTSKDEVEDRVRGFELGADDYVTKPLEPQEFVARVKAKLSRLQAATAPPTLFTRGSFKLDLISQKAFLSLEGKEVDLGLTPIEFKLFSLFLKNEGKVYPRADLKKFVWGPTIHLSDHTVDTHVSSLRKKLIGHSACLKSMVKMGYIFNLSQAPQP